MGVTMAQAVAEVLGTEVVNWHHGVQLVRDGGFKPQGGRSLQDAAGDLAKGLRAGGTTRQLGEVLCLAAQGGVRQQRQQDQEAARVASVKDAWDRQVFHAVKVQMKVKV